MAEAAKGMPDPFRIAVLRARMKFDLFALLSKYFCEICGYKTLTMLIRNSLSRSLILILLLATSTGIAFAQSLREQAERRGVLIGTAVNPALLGEAAYAATLARQFNMVEPEKAMKWGAIRPAQDKFNFGPGDQVVGFAQAHKMKVRGHCLLWSEYNPAWLSKGSFAAEQLSKLLREHIATVMKHYSGKVFAWDVVNEAFLAN